MNMNEQLFTCTTNAGFSCVYRARLIWALLHDCSPESTTLQKGARRHAHATGWYQWYGCWRLTLHLHKPVPCRLCLAAHVLWQPVLFNANKDQIDISDVSHMHGHAPFYTSSGAVLMR